MRDRFAAAHRAEQDRGQRYLQHDEDGADQDSHREPAQQLCAHLLTIAGAERLRGEGQRSHAQEGEQPEQAVEDDGGDRDASEQRGIAEPPDRHRRDDADQGRRQVRDHRRPCDGEDLRARDLRGGSQQATSAAVYRPRGAPNIRDNSQTGITMTAPSRK